MAKININRTNTEKVRGWKYCVSTSTSFMSLSWIEHFFTTKEDASAFAKEARKQGYVSLTVSRDEY